MSSNNLTDNDRKLLAAAWHCFETQPKASPHQPLAANVAPLASARNAHVNFAKLAEIMGYKNAQTASACFGPVKKKLLASAGESAGTPTPKKKAAAATGKGKGKRLAEVEAGDGEDDDDEETPVAKTPKKAKKAKAMAQVDAEAEIKAVGDGEEESEFVIKGEVEDD